jgi:hypothetical protein
VQITGANSSLSMRTLKVIRQLKLKNIVFSFEMSTWRVLPSYRKAICHLYWRKRTPKTQKREEKLNCLHA